MRGLKVETAVNSSCGDGIANKKAYPYQISRRVIPARRRLTLQELLSITEVTEAKLRVEEAIAAYQYTGPLFQVAQTNASILCIVGI